MKPVLRSLAWLLALALLALPVVAVVEGWMGGEHWPLRTLRVQGALARVDRAQLQAAVLPHARRGFFAVDLGAIQRTVDALPWVERAQVRKHWPDVLEVRIVEHRPPVDRLGLQQLDQLGVALGHQAGIGEVGALVAQRRVGDLPAVAALADDLLLRHPDVGEE